MTVSFRRHNGANGWVDAPAHVWANGGWGRVVGAPVAPGARSFTVKPYTETVDAPLMSPPPAITTAATTAAALIPSGVKIAPGDTTKLRHLGNLPVRRGDTIGANLGNASTLSFRHEAWAFETVHTGSRIALRVTGSPSTVRAYTVHIDGQRVTADPIPAAGSQQVLLDFGATATRTIRVDLSNMGFEGVDIDQGATLAPTTERPHLFIMGDSWVEGGSWHPNAEGMNVNDPALVHMAHLTGRILDASTYIGGYGGTGYVNGATATTPRHYASPWRTDFIVQSRPDAVLVFGSINDSTTDEAVGTNATALFDRLNTELPGVPVIVVGRQSYGPNSHNSTTTDSSPHLRTAADAAPNVSGYVDPVAEDWITGTGNTVSPTGDGTADLYHNGHHLNHLSLAGNRFYAEKLAQIVETLTA